MKKNSLKILILILFLFPFSSFSQENLKLTITPPLIKVNFNPGQIWQGSIKVVNNNPQDLNIFVSVMDFKSGPEGGILFIKAPKEEDRKFLLSQWIEFSKETILIPAFQSKEIYFTIKVPEDAEPGGKYAAILVGTKPPEEVLGSAIKVTPLVSSLILATVRGETKEAIWIREFSTDKIFYKEPKVNFTLKIENIGNVHIKPRGEIKILNMYGKERGNISFNQTTEYGNILPQSSRKWNFTWEGKESFFEIGRYQAILTLIYGNEIENKETREIYFWIVPLAPLMLIFGVFLGFFVAIFLIVRIYVKRTIALSIAKLQEQVLEVPPKENIIFTSEKGEKIFDIKKLEPISEEKKRKALIFLRKEIFVFLISILLILAIMILLFLIKGLKEEKDFKAETQVEKEKISPENIMEQVKKEKIEIESREGKLEIDKKSFSISVLNGTGIKGLANKVATLLEKEGFKIEKIGNAENFKYQNTLIKYKKGKEREAKFLNKFFEEKFKIVEHENQEEDIILIIGLDFSSII